MDEVADRIDRSKSWIVRQAVAEWLAEEQRRHELTLEAMKSVDEGRTLTQEEVEKHFAERRRSRSRGTKAA
jgi:predicted transcriptional regulator